MSLRRLRALAAGLLLASVFLAPGLARADDDGTFDDDPPKKKHLDDAPKAKPASDDVDSPKKKSDDGDDTSVKKKPASDDDAETPVQGGWGAIAGNPPNGQVLHGELGIPGLRMLYLASKGDRLAYGGGGEIDFPPLDAAGNSTRGFNAIRFIGRLDYDLPTDVLILMVHFEPEWIAVIGNGQGSGLFYMPVQLGAAFDLKVVHLEADVGLALLMTGSSFFFPFTGAVLASPFIGAGVEYPVSDAVALTFRLRLQTFAWDSAPAGTTLDRAPTLFGFGNVLAGVAYRF